MLNSFSHVWFSSVSVALMLLPAKNIHFVSVLNVFFGIKLHFQAAELFRKPPHSHKRRHKQKFLKKSVSFVFFKKNVQTLYIETSA